MTSEDHGTDGEPNTPAVKAESRQNAAKARARDLRRQAYDRAKALKKKLKASPEALNRAEAQKQRQRELRRQAYAQAKAARQDRRAALKERDAQAQRQEAAAAAEQRQAELLASLTTADKLPVPTRKLRLIKE